DQRKREIVFDLPRGARAEDFRAVTFSNAKFPATFFNGRTDFDPRQQTSYWGWNWYYGGIISDSRLIVTEQVGTTGLLSNNVSGTTLTTDTATVAPAPVAVESDIWQIVGSRLLFFNQYRGLQVFDLSDPAAPVKTGGLRMAASGEQMYVLDAVGDLAALVLSTQSGQAGAVALIQIRNGVPRELARIALPGTPIDSRFLGDQIHVVTATSASDRQALVTISLSDVARPQVLSQHTLSGVLPEMQAVGDKLLVATKSDYVWGQWSFWNQTSIISVFQATAGAPQLLKTVQPQGMVWDKFNLSIVGDALVAITQTRTAGLQTWVETFPLSGAAAAPLARVSIPAAAGETLYATRFHGPRAYVVTFRRIDPLFVIDLTDPAAPIIAGELEIPGWSTYLEPRGEDQLIAVGVEGARVTASLFDVKDIRQPQLLSRVFVGAPGQYSWSEANYEEKAVEFLPDQGLLLMPVWSYGYDANWNWSGRQGMQIVNVAAESLTLGDIIPHAFTARRGTLVGDHIVSISGRELLVTPRNDPTGPPAAQLSLSWSVDHVVSCGDYLVQIEEGYALGAMLRVTTAADPDGLIEEIDPGPGIIRGVERRGNDLFILQTITHTDANGGVGGNGMRTWRFDLSAMPVLRETGRTELWPNDQRWYSSRYRAVWPRQDLLVWAPEPQDEIYEGGLRAARLSFIGNRWSRAYGMTSPVQYGAHLLPVRLTPSEIVAEPELTLGDSSKRYGRAEAQNGMVFLSLESTEQPARPDARVIRHGRFGEAVGERGVISNGVTVLADVHMPPLMRTMADLAVAGPVTPASGITATGPLVIAQSMVYIGWDYGTPSWWSALHVVDFSGNAPVVRDPVPLPGRLVAVSHADEQGAILVTGDPYGHLRTLAYDGVASWEFADPAITALEPGKEGNLLPTQFASNAEAVFLTANEGQDPSSVEGYAYDLASRTFQQTARLSLDFDPYRMELRNGQLFLFSGSDFHPTSITLAAVGAGGRLAAPMRAYLPDYGQLSYSLSPLCAEWSGTAVLLIPAGPYGVERLNPQDLNSGVAVGPISQSQP
ncbi:MAG: beta-propeller domain-containing protein, partial [Verrucomicrobiales bacterium]|nr:beta-propeller domain-containing protein [Verrucomicrobiales bacterium]